LKTTYIKPEMIQDAQCQQRNLALCWIDIANAHGSVQHNLIHLALNHYTIFQNPSHLSSNTCTRIYLLWLLQIFGQRGKVEESINLLLNGKNTPS
jgi:hypothetical protein